MTAVDSSHHALPSTAAVTQLANPDSGSIEERQVSEGRDAEQTAGGRNRWGDAGALRENDGGRDLCRAAEVMFTGSMGCVRSESGHLHCWGVNADFNVGVRGGEPCGPNLETVCIRAPVLVPGIDSVTKVASGGGATCAVRNDGTVWCWGSNIAGLLGDGIEELCDAPGASTSQGLPQPCSADPVRIEGIGRATDIDSWGAMCASNQAGEVFTWGWYGRKSPIRIPGITNAVAVEDGCALLADGGVVCWPPDTLAAELIDWNGAATDLTLGYTLGCVIDEQGALFCWNLETHGKTSNRFDCLSGVSCAHAPTRFEVERRVVQASGGNFPVLWILTDDGKVSPIVAGELQAALELPTRAIQISAGVDGACAVLEDGSVYCWTNPGVTNALLDLGPEPTQIELCQ